MTETTETKKYTTDQVGEITADELAALAEHHQIILARAMAGESYITIAEQTGLKLGTVRSRLNRARNAVLAQRAKLATATGPVTATMSAGT
mgnify:CR=1 FL=1